VREVCCLQTVGGMASTLATYPVCLW